MSFINLLGSIVFSESQLLVRGDRLIREKYSRDYEDVLNRIATGLAIGSYTPTVDEHVELAEYQTHVLDVREIVAQSRYDNTLVQGAIAYERSTARLAQYIKSEGVDEVLAVDATYDEDGIELIPEVVYISPIEPLPLQVAEPIYNDNGDKIGEGLIDNPVVVQDELERIEAHTITNAASIETLALVKVRSL